MSDPVLRVERVSKRFGDVRALRDVSLEFLPGEIHGLLGENGAGKSTLMSVLAGFVVPDSGSVRVAGGAIVPFGRPHEVRAMGIEMVHQHFMLVPEFTVLENFALGTMDLMSGVLDAVEVSSRLSGVADDLGWEIDASARTGSLPVGLQQRLEIMKALAGRARVLILDEPTAVLSPDEVLDLFRVLRRLRDGGTCVILIAHKLSEVMSVADRVTVLRHGEFVATSKTADVDEATLATWMVGDLPAARSPVPQSGRGVLVSVRGLKVGGARGEEAVRGATFEVNRGEVLGIGGVSGNGQIELAEALAGLRAVRSGEIAWSEPGATVGYVPQDRQGQGLALSMSVRDNFLIGGLDDVELWQGPFLKPTVLRGRVAGLVRDYAIKVGGTGDPARSLSGGNQQKLVVSRTLSRDPDLIVAHNPTRGLDVRATAFVQDRILSAARAGASVVLFTTDLDELASLSSRTLFMNRGALNVGGAGAMVG
jgi:simple sugar transport system ATP-binding protein